MVKSEDPFLPNSRGPKTEKSSNTQSGDIPSKNPAIWLVESNLYQDLRRKISQDMGFAQEDIKNIFSRIYTFSKNWWQDFQEVENSLF